MDNSVEVRTVEVRYAGVVVGRGALVKDLGPEGLFVGLPEPLPVGTLVTLKVGDALREARVADVVESADPALAGMRIFWSDAAPASVETAPAEPAAAAPEAGPTPDAESGDEGSGAIAAPLSLAGGDAPQPGGGKRRRKRR